MSALAMILTAAMVVPGDGAEKTSEKVVKPHVLDLNGDWMFTFDSIDDKEHKISGRDFMRSLKVRDEGDGNLRLTIHSNGKELPCLGIYRQESDKVLISFRPEKRGRPTGFQKSVNYIITLRCVKYRK